MAGRVPRVMGGTGDRLGPFPQFGNSSVCPGVEFYPPWVGAGAEPPSGVSQVHSEQQRFSNKRFSPFFQPLSHFCHFLGGMSLNPHPHPVVAPQTPVPCLFFPLFSPPKPPPLILPPSPSCSPVCRCLCPFVPSVPARSVPRQGLVLQGMILPGAPG